jgi:hypothetical protein
MILLIRMMPILCLFCLYLILVCSFSLACNTTLHVPIPDDSWAQNPAQPSTGLCEAPGVMPEPDGPLASNPTQPPYGLRVPPYAPTEPLRPQPHAFLHI